MLPDSPKDPSSKESLQYIAVLYKIDSIIPSPPYHYNFKLRIPVKASGRARLCVAEWSTSYPVYNLVNKTLSFTHLHSEFSFLKVFVFLQSHTDHHN